MVAYPQISSIVGSNCLWVRYRLGLFHDGHWFTKIHERRSEISDCYAIGIGSSIPFIAAWLVSLSSGWIDVAIRRKWLSVTATRKLFSCINHIGFPLALIAASYGGCDRTLVVGLFILPFALSGTYYPGMGINFLDLSPNYSATIAAEADTLSCIAEIVTPYIVGLLTPKVYTFLKVILRKFILIS